MSDNTQIPTPSNNLGDNFNNTPFPPAPNPPNSTVPPNQQNQQAPNFNQYREKHEESSGNSHSLGGRHRISVSQHSDRSASIHFLEKEPRMPAYKGPIKGVKIEPLEKELFFNGTNLPIEKCIRRYENAGSADGASYEDLARQVVSFLKGENIKEEVEHMTGHETLDWELLKQKLLDRYGSPLPLVRYTKKDLTQLVLYAVQAGGIKTLEEFKTFRTKYEAITNYLFIMGHSTHLEESRELLVNSLSP
ncbi:hypothetical protein PCANC_24677 [Puccinia coronata f. sp. avenae]|uniref:Uncharacterized protein n=1 Tax=Puccinia coronata f. sp. avenae TaxID=200324 RepID=A0A2N5TZ18_9BASI|nr:hypothetical protein PCANC_24677 [Puccinia coronata f. sp. avenae]